MSIKYKESGLININNEQPLGEFTADDEMPVGGSGGYVEGKKIIIIFESFSNVSGEIIIAFTQTALNAVYNELHKETCNHQWDDGVEVEGGAGAYLIEYTCTVCGEKEQQIITVIPPEGNHFLRNQAGAEWLREISADDIDEIKMISGGGGPLPPISFTYISSSRDKAIVSSIFEEYYWLDSKPVSEESTQIPDGGYFIVQFVLNNGEVKQLYFINGDFYYDGNGNYFELVRLPVFRDGTNFVNHYGFERQYNPCPIYLIDGTPVCEIPLSELEFIELRDDIYLDNEFPTHYLEINGERVYFIKGEYFYIGDDRSVYYQLIGNIDELIAEYNK